MLRIIEKQFRQPSGFLGKIVSIIMQKGYSKAYTRIIDSLEIKEKEHVFEIGYGHGLGIKKILVNTNCFVSGIDYSKLMNKLASKRNKKNINNGKVKLYYGDFLDYKIKPDLYNKIYFLNILYFWDKLEVPLTKINVGLKEKGIFCFYMDHPDELSRQGFMKEDLFNKYTIDVVIEKLRFSGFNKIDYQQDKMGYFVKCMK